MISVSVFSNNHIDIETQEYSIETRADMVRFLKQLLDKAKYSGEHITLEIADIKEGLVNYIAVERW